LRVKPYNVRDGDIIAVKNKQEDPENKDNFILHKSDRKANHINKEYKPKDKKKTTSARAPVREAKLVIQVDL